MEYSAPPSIDTSPPYMDYPSLFLQEILDPPSYMNFQKSQSPVNKGASH